MLTLAALTKSYATPVLKGIDLRFEAGEVHALVGENGAGKSTLARILAGLTEPDGGRMVLDGQTYRPGSRADAERAGIRMVTQELTTIGNLTVAENIYLSRLPSRWGVMRQGRLRTQAAAHMRSLGLASIDPDQPVRTLGLGAKQLVEIAAALAQPCRVLILDEPTTALSDTERDLLFVQVAALSSSGAAVLYISHRLEEIKRIARRVTVLRDGSVVATQPAGGLSISDVVTLMVGREPRDEVRREAARRPEPALTVRHLTRAPFVRDVSFEVRQGEILGLAGLMGSGRTELLRTIFGADTPDGGAIHVAGSAQPGRIRSPREAVRLGIGFLTEDRKDEGLCLSLDVAANMTLARLEGVSRLGCVRRTEERSVAEGLAQRIALRYHSLDQPVAELSGGNQQKTLLARWLHRGCRILLCDEPTRGIDVGARTEIYTALADLAAQGTALLVASSDLQEPFTICDRIGVMSAGRLVTVLERGGWSEERIMAAALSELRSRPMEPDPAAPAGAPRRG
jgi:ribose transport system ATP-binding protein